MKRRRSDRSIPDLNTLLIPDDTAGPGRCLIDPATYGIGGGTRCYFRNIQAAFLEELEGAQAVVGCVAWFTDMAILRAMSHLTMVSVIVQKEDFLRPDAVGKESIRAAYKALPMPYDRWRLPKPIGDLSTCGDSMWQSVRCVGNHNSAKNPVHPRMHHKFVAFCSVEEPPEDEGGPRFIALRPYKIWTGSFNLTYVGGRSLENAMVTEDPAIVDAYFREWTQVACLSEPLDWRSEWAEPEHRIGS